MKKNFKSLFLTTVALLTSANTFAAWETEGQGTKQNGTWYALYDTQEAKKGKSDFNEENLTLVAPPLAMTGGQFGQNYGAVSSSIKFKQVINGTESEIGSVDVPYDINFFKGTGNMYKYSDNISAKSMNSEATILRLRSSGGDALYYWRKNVTVTQATYTNAPSESSLNFGTITLGESVTKTFTIKYSNGTSGKGLTISSNNSAYSTDVTSIAEGKYGEKTITVTFKPTSVGNFNGTITISGNGAETRTVSLSGTALPAVPTATNATNVTAKSFTANWNTSTGATSYKLNVYNSSSELVFSTETPSTTVNITGLDCKNGNSYTYNVTALNGSFQSKTASNTISVTTQTAIINVNAQSFDLASVIGNSKTATLNITSQYLVENISLALQNGNKFSINPTSITNNGDVTITFSSTEVGKYNDVIVASSECAENVIITLSGTATPTAPVAKDATFITNSSFIANWNSVPNASKYEVYLNGIQKATTTSTSFIFTDLTADTEYQYYVKAYVGDFVSENSNTITLKTLPNPTIFISGKDSISAVNGGSNTLELSISSKNAIGNINIAITDESGFFSIDKTSISESGKVTLTFEPKNVGTYKTTVTISSDYAESKSLEITGTAYPTAPVATDATNILPNSFTANWSSVADADNYKLFINGKETYTGTETSYSATCTPNTDYTYVVTATVNGLVSEKSNEISVKSLPTPVIGISGDTNIKTTYNTSKDLTLTIISENTINDINVVLTDESGYFSIDKTTISKNGNIVLTFAPTTVGEFNATVSISSDLAESKSITIDGTSAPVAPTATAATNVRCETFTANWNALTGANSYTLYLNGVKKYEGTNTSYDLSGLTANTNYTYNVTAEINGFVTDYSNTINVTTLPTPIINISGDDEKEIVVNETADFTLNVTSENTIEDIAISLEDESGFFSIDKTSISENGTVIATFAPTSVGKFSATVKINSDLAEEKTIVLNGTANPTAPVATEATNIRCETFTANWEEVANATYTLYLNGEEKYNGTETSYNLTNLTANTDYKYYVAATVNELTSSKSNEISVKTLPIPVINISGDDEKEIVVNETADYTLSITSENTIEDIAVSLEDESGFFSIDKTSVSENGTIIAAFAPTSVGKFSATVKINSDLAEEKTIVLNGTANPTAPIATAATNITGIAFTANWNAVANTSKYIVNVKSVNGESNYEVEGSKTSYDVTNLISSTEYTYTVSAKVSELTSEKSNEISVTTTGGAAISYNDFDKSFVTNRNTDVVRTVTVNAAELIETIDITTNGNDNFSIINNTLTKDGGTFDIKFAPNTVGNFANEITLSSGETSVKINVTGTANLETPVATEATEVKPTSFVANWDAMSGATFTLYVNEEVKYNGTNNSFLLDNLTPNKNYSYYVIANIDTFVSEKSNTINVGTEATPIISISGRNKAETIANSTDTIKLNIVGENLLGNINIALTDESGVFSIDKNTLTESGEVILTFAPTAIGTYNGSINISSDFAENKQFNFNGICIPNTPIAKDASDVRGTTFVGNWESVSENATYCIIVKKNAQNVYQEYTKDTNIKVTGLEPTTDYTYNIYAIIDDIWSDASNEINVTTKKPVIAYESFDTSFELQINDYENRTITLTPSYLDEQISVAIEGDECFSLNDVITNKDGGSFVLQMLPRATGNFNAKITLTSGVAENVTINITGVSTPRKTPVFAANDITNNSFVAYWSTTEGATNYILKVNGEEVYRGNKTSYEVIGLNANSDYNLELIAIDDNNIESEAAQYAVSTVSVPVIKNITALSAFKTIVGKTQNQVVNVKAENLLGNILINVDGDDEFIISNGQISANEDLTIGLTSNVPGNYSATLTFSSRNAENVTLNVNGTVTPKTATSKAATNITSSSFNANWVASSDKATYKVVVKNGSTIVATKNVAAGNSSATIDGLSANTNYTYTVTAIENSVEATTSESISVTTKAESTVTLNVAVSAEKTTATAKWSIISDEEVTPTSVTISCNGTSKTLSGNETSYTITGLSKSSSYTVTVSAVINGKTYTKNVSIATKGDYYGSQLRNPEFELWESSTEEKAEPIGWNSFYSAKTTTVTSFGKHQAMDKSTTVKRPGTNGSTSVYIWTKEISGIKANGNMTTGKINMGSATATSAKNYNFTDTSDSNHNTPFTEIPDSLTVWVKFESGDASKGPAGVSAYIHGNANFQDPVSSTYSSYLVATAAADISPNTSSWVRLSVPFTVNNATVTPQYILCSFKTNNVAAVGTDGEKLYIDDALMIYKPTMTVNNLATTSYKPGDAISVGFSITGTMSPYNLNVAANVAYLELSDKNGSFGNPTVIDQITTDFGGTFMGNIPTNLADGNYKIRVRTTNYPMTSATQSITVSAPTLSVPVATEATDVTNNSFVANWNEASNAEGYYITVLNSNDEVVEGYNKLDVGNSLYETITINNYVDGGTYKYSVISYNSTSESVSSNTISVKLTSTTNLDESIIENFKLDVYPNPVVDVLYIDNAEAISQIAVYTTSGALVLNQNEENASVNVTNLSQGTYILNVTTTNGRKYHTVFVKKK